jgi:hypothetical protein
MYRILNPVDMNAFHCSGPYKYFLPKNPAPGLLESKGRDLELISRQRALLLPQKRNVPEEWLLKISVCIDGGLLPVTTLSWAGQRDRELYCCPRTGMFRENSNQRFLN